MQYKCPSCGNLINQGDAFCSKCGQKFNWPAPVPTQTPVIPKPITPNQEQIQPNTHIPLNQENYSNTAQPDVSPAAFNTTSEVSSKTKSRKRENLLIAVSIILVICIIVGIIFAIKYFVSDKGFEKTPGIKKHSASNPKSDSLLGLRNIKFDSQGKTELTQEELQILTYFDNDYITIDSYDFLRRYPEICEGAQLALNGLVKKVISETNEEYQILLWLGESEGKYFYKNNDPNAIENYERYVAEHTSDYVIIKGKTTNPRLVENDWITLKGRYETVQTVKIDGTSFTVPVINVSSASLMDKYGWDTVVAFSDSFIRSVAKTIFGDNIELRKPVPDKDYTEGTGHDVSFYVVTPENQSNSKFNEYRFYSKKGYIEDITSDTGEFWLLGSAGNYTRYIEFAPDFKHFFIFTFDHDLDFLTLDYYDKSFNKVWSREFEETLNAKYDFTENNIYLVANNELYIINTETGENTYEPTFVGAKSDVRKLEDGILLIADYSGSKTADAIMKTDLSGNIIWKVNQMGSSYGAYGYSGVQLIGEKILVQYGDYFVVVNDKTGEKILDVEWNRDQ